jgi:hypothetical protein
MATSGYTPYGNTSSSSDRQAPGDKKRKALDDLEEDNHNDVPSTTQEQVYVVYSISYQQWVPPIQELISFLRSNGWTGLLPDCAFSQTDLDSRKADIKLVTTSRDNAIICINDEVYKWTADSGGWCVPDWHGSTECRIFSSSAKAAGDMVGKIWLEGPFPLRTAWS